MENRGHFPDALGADGQGTDDLEAAVERVSREAFDLAKEVAKAGGAAESHVERARAIDAELDRLWPRIEAAPAERREALTEVWTDARLDVEYVFTDGQAPTSLRLFHFLQDLAPEK